MKVFLARIEYILLCAIVFVLPLHKRIIPYVIASFCLVFIINGGFKRIAQNVRSTYLIFTSAYYFFLIFGLLYTDVMPAGLFDLEVKFSLFLFPFLFAGIQLSSRQFSEVFLWFIFGCMLATIICIMSAIMYYFDTYDPSVFYYQQLSVFQHPSYFSMYLNFCIYFIYYFMVFNKEEYKIKSDLVSILIIIIFSLFVVLLSSKIGLVTLFLVIFTGTLLWFLKSRAVFPSIMVFAMLSTMIYFSFRYSNQIQGRLQEAVNSISEDKVTFTTTGARLVIWKSGLEIFLDSPLFGYGTGDVKDELVKTYKKYNYEHLVMFQLNAHNQYLQMLIAIGLIGSLFFWAYLFYPVFDKRFIINSVYIGFLALILINFLAESMLETQAGVVFYAFFNSLLYFNLDKIVPLKMRVK